MKSFVLVLSLFIALGSPALTLSQNHTGGARPHTPADASDSPSRTPKEVVYGTADDGYPEKLTIQGEIKQVTLVPAYCGMVRYAGTMQVELTKPLSGYNDPYVYLVVPCLLGPQKEAGFLGKQICATVKKMYEESFYEGRPINTIDSGGVPFYSLEWGTGSKDSFFGQVGCPPESK